MTAAAVLYTIGFILTVAGYMIEYSKEIYGGSYRAETWEVWSRVGGLFFGALGLIVSVVVTIARMLS